MEDDKAVPMQGISFDETLLAGQVAPSSLRMYRRDFLAYMQFAGTPENALKPTTLARWRTHLVLTEKKTAATIIRMMSAVKSLMTAAEEQGYIEQGLAEKFKRVRGVKSKALKERSHARTRISKEDMRRLTDAPDATTLKGMRDRALLHTLATSGIRVSEAATLTIQQIGQEGQNYYLMVQGKNDEKPRRANLSPEAYEAIQLWLARRGVEADALFLGFARRKGALQATHMSSVSVWRAVQEYANKCGLSHVKPHDFRRFVGTQLAQTDIRKAQQALGHKRIETTALYDLKDAELGMTNNLY